MAKRVIVLEKQGPGQFRVAYWLAVPASRQPFYANPAATSQWKDASGAEVAQLQSGEVREVVETYSSEGAPTLSLVQAAFEERWTNLQAETTVYNPWLRYGSYWDGTTWTVGGVS